MKKFLSTTLAFVILLSQFAGSSFASSDNATLSQAVLDSFLKDNIKMESDGKISFGGSNISFDGFQNFDGEKVHENVDLNIKIEGKDFSKIPGEDFSDFSFDGGVSFDTYFDYKDLDLFFKFYDLEADVESDNEDIVTMTEGMTEVFKIYSDKYYYLPIGDFIEMAEEFSDMEEIEELNSYFLTAGKDGGVKFFAALIDAKVFEVTKNNSGKYEMCKNP